MSLTETCEDPKDTRIDSEADNELLELNRTAASKILLAASRNKEEILDAIYDFARRIDFYDHKGIDTSPAEMPLRDYQEFTMTCC